LLLLAYTFVGVQHRARDTLMSDMTSAVAILDAAGESVGDPNGKLSGAAHHCGEFCYSVMMPDSVRAFVKTAFGQALESGPDIYLSDIAPDQETPPPRLLT